MLGEITKPLRKKLADKELKQQESRDLDLGFSVEALHLEEKKSVYFPSLKKPVYRAKLKIFQVSRMLTSLPK